MKLTKTSAYAVLSLCYLATRRDDGPVQARQVAEHLGLQVDSTLKILQALARERLLRSQLGRGGGYVFHRPTSAVTLLEVIEAIDGPLKPEVPVHDHPELAPLTTRLRDICESYITQGRAALARITLDQIAEAD